MLSLEGGDLPSALLSQHVRFWSTCYSVAASQPSVSPNPRWSAALMKTLEHRHFHSNTIKPRPPKHTPVPRLAAAPKGVEPITCFWRVFTNRRIAEAELTKEFNNASAFTPWHFRFGFKFRFVGHNDANIYMYPTAFNKALNSLCCVILLYLHLF